MKTSSVTIEQGKTWVKMFVSLSCKIPLMPGFPPDFQEELRKSSRKDLSCSRGWQWITRIT